MLEESDIKRLTDALVSKAEFNERVGRLEEDLAHVKYAVDSMVTSFDKMAKNIEDPRDEYIAIKL